MQQNKMCVDIIVPCRIFRKGKKFNLILKSVMIVDTITGGLKITQYYDKIKITIADLVETTWLTRYLDNEYHV